LAQTVDTIIFIEIGFGFPPLPLLLTLVIGQLGMKWIFSLLYRPLLYLAVWWIEKGKSYLQIGNPPGELPESCEFRSRASWKGWS
jgi:uncharacterized PurR-regulated membrane protein YhhQ (DUF165 family)